MKRPLVKFASKGTESFFDTIKEDVNHYFEDNKITANANNTMRFKTVFMISLFFVPYLFMVTGLTSHNLFVFYGMWILSGLGMVGIGTAVMHDSNHGSYSKNKFVNKFLGDIINYIGAYSKTWKIQHNVLHHTYTNVDGLDEDIDSPALMRFSPHLPLKKIHRFQHIYSWFLYMLLTLFWVTVKDYRMLVNYNKNGLLRKQKIDLKKALIEVTVLKVFYFGYIIVLPIIFAGVPWYHVVFGFLTLHAVAGLALSCIFQPAHVMESSEFNLPVLDNKMEHSWAEHQIRNTVNYSAKSRFTSWFIGGLNYQIEHHLFPHVCHVHYPKISKIVKRVAAQYNLPYLEHKTFIGALVHHGKMLKKLGRA